MAMGLSSLKHISLVFFASFLLLMISLKSIQSLIVTGLKKHTSSRVLTSKVNRIISTRLSSSSPDSSIINQNPALGIDFYNLDVTNKSISFGDYSIIASQSISNRKYTSLEDIEKDNGPKEGIYVCLCTFVCIIHACIRSRCIYIHIYIIAYYSI